MLTEIKNHISKTDSNKAIPQNVIDGLIEHHQEDICIIATEIDGESFGVQFLNKPKNIQPAITTLTKNLIEHYTH